MIPSATYSHSSDRMGWEPVMIRTSILPLAPSLLASDLLRDPLAETPAPFSWSTLAMTVRGNTRWRPEDVLQHRLINAGGFCWVLRFDKPLGCSRETMPPFWAGYSLLLADNSRWPTESALGRECTTRGSRIRQVMPRRCWAYGESTTRDSLIKRCP